MVDKEFEMVSERHSFDNKQSTNSVIYDGSKESVEKIMDLVGFSRGINNTPDYLVFLGEIIPKGSIFLVSKIVFFNYKLYEIIRKNYSTIYFTQNAITVNPFK